MKVVVNMDHYLILRTTELRIEIQLDLEKIKRKRKWNPSVFYVPLNNISALNYTSYKKRKWTEKGNSNTFIGQFI